MADWTSALARARAHAPYLALGLDRHPDLAHLLATGDGEGALAAARAAAPDEADIAAALRREKRALGLVLAIGDLAGAFPLGKVMRELSLLADRALHRAIAAAIARRVPDAQPDGFIALALGKHGAGELNYSSDIDPILLYDPDILPRRPRDEPGEAAQRYAREVVRLLSEVREDGYVFRVDLRLRPAAEVSPPAVPLGGAITHYEGSALAWERAAFIRARACAGDIAAGEAFLDHIRPFVWRRSLDFGAIDEVRRLTRRIREGHDGPACVGEGFDVKLGRGGIREVEFFAQTHQLIHGGRDATLRSRQTRPALDALAATGRIAAADAGALGEAYDGLRRIEHRLQMVADRQTHRLPGGAALDGVARLDGYEDTSAWLAHIAGLTTAVAERYDRLLAEDGASVPGDAPHVLPQPGALAPAGAALAARISGWRKGRYRVLRSPAAIAAFDAIRDTLTATIAASPDPERAAARWETVLDRLPSAINLFRLLEARPGLLNLVADCLALAPPLADAIARRPALLDRLIDRSALDLPGSAAQLADAMRQGERGDSYEQRLDRIRIVTGETRFALGVQLIEAAHDPLAIAAALSRTAEAALIVCCEAAAAEFAKAHGTIDGSELVILALGRLGGGILTHASDLDLVFLFTGRHDAESDGARPLGATLYYNRLAQRVGAALSVPTAEGALYDVDTRLRPQGATGPLAVGLAAFARYQHDDAWTWEHMAMTRARVVHGSAAARSAVAAALTSAFARPRAPGTIRADALAMRQQMAGAKPPRGPLDVKLMRGGLVDLEFAVHCRQLETGDGQTPDLGAALTALSPPLPPAAKDAHDLLTRALVAGRLLAPDTAMPPPAAAARLAGLCWAADIDALLAALRDARACVAETWSCVFGQTLEIEP